MKGKIIAAGVILSIACIFVLGMTVMKGGDKSAKTE